MNDPRHAAQADVLASDTDAALALPEDRLDDAHSRASVVWTATPLPVPSAERVVDSDMVTVFGDLSTDGLRGDGRRTRAALGS